MSVVSIVTVAAAVAFLLTMASLHSGRARSTHLAGVTYHLLLLPAVAALPAPTWVAAAGFGWLMLDTAIGGAQLQGLEARIAHQLRLGTHLPAAVWVAGAAVTGAETGVWWLAVVGLLFAAVQAAMTLRGEKRATAAWMFATQAGLNVAWTIAVAVHLA